MIKFHLHHPCFSRMTKMLKDENIQRKSRKLGKNMKISSKRKHRRIVHILEAILRRSILKAGRSGH